MHINTIATNNAKVIINKELSRVNAEALQKLKEKDLSQMIISDPMALYYLTGRLIDPGERLLAL